MFLLFSSTLLLFNVGCNKSSSYKSSSEIYDDYKDGTYCAEIEYYNPSTGTRNTYNLNVEVEGGELTTIYWPNGGWLDDTHFYPEDITYGYCEFTSDKGYQYTVTLEEFGGCEYTDEYEIRRDVNNEVEATTCTKCGSEKDSYDDYCYNCQRKIEDQEENTCSSCGSYEYGIYGGICSSCENDDDEDYY